MPTGPSHSGGGFGGHSSHSSHSSGGFSGGGGSFGFHRHTGPHHFHWFGRTVIISGGHYSSAVSFISVAIFLIIFAVFMGFMAYSNANYIKEYKASVVVFEEDAEFFEDVITKAKNGEDGYYLANANFDGQIYYNYEDYDVADTGAFIYDYYNNNPYFFIKYAYENLHHLDEDENPYIHYGETYAQFSSSAIAGMISVTEETGFIQIAYTYADGAWWSINTSYSLNNNVEYKLTLQAISDKEGSQKILIGSIVVFALIVAGCISGAVFKLVSGAKKAKAEAEFTAQKNEAELSEARARAEEAAADADRKQNYVCSYCGSDIPAGETKCPTCGSSKRTKK